ncbi:nucleotide-diphospho-sugar transferase [Pontibacter silvestris]|uniref:Nucleotide-diphospho-sugar transferase n=1 Tax=Pontibacter silvestris TaxID=2305183 RepID=A0ABW4WZ77_9BACT|nr:nucleotide-diphospho-sugar transferase [Pontibacter silvestris]MCC9135130.1 nucleotide-diphospho-sugar transferase [Pontibacter silvestris]
MDQDFHTPILFLIFNRPDTTQQVFNAIRNIKPKDLYVAADGPRSNKPGETEDCIATRSIVEQVDWDCKVHTLFRNENLGCRVAVSSAIDWFFENVEEGIILEDDCLPNQSFFWFCQELLEKYRNDDRVMHISGSNYQFGKKWGEGSYYFSRLAHIWGWASWRRAWKHYDVQMKSLPQFIKENKIASIFSNKTVQKNWIKNLEKIYNGANTWDYQWAYTNLNNNSYCIIPNVNLISNIGFGKKSTHTFDEEDVLSKMPTEEINEIVHPKYLEYNVEADYFTNTKVFPPLSLLKRIRIKLKKVLF